MTTSFSLPADPLARAQWIDGLCDEFEAAWLAGQSPQIQDFLARAAEGDRTALAQELLPLDTHYRRQHGSSATAAATISVGANQVQQEISRGGMGIVFKGWNTNLRRGVAVKVLLERHRGENELIKRFIDEAQISGQLQHPGIAPIYELGEFPDGRPYFTMKLIQGETLAKLLAARAGPREDLPRLLRIFEQVCQTLAYVHSRGVIHRDLKPANIMVGAFGEVQVMDWGLAKVLVEGAPPRCSTLAVGEVRTARSRESVATTGLDSHTQFGSILGTLAYMPPEQALGEIDHLDQRTDVFGLGAILCEILTGRPPYVAPNFAQLRRKAVRAELAEAFDCLTYCGVDEELTSLTRRALAPAQADRPADAGVLAAELVRYREGVEKRLRLAELAQAQAVTHAAQERARRKLILMYSGALLAVLALGVVGVSWGLIRSGYALRAESQARESLRRDLYVADLQLANQMWESPHGTAKNVSALLEGHVPLEGQSDLREFAWRLQWTTLHRNSGVLKAHIDGARQVAFLSDKELVTLDGELTLRRWSLPAGTMLNEVRHGELSPGACWAISANGEKVALGSAGRVQVFETQSSEKPLTLSGQALGICLSADGSRLGTVWSDGRAQVWNTQTDREIVSQILRQPEQLSDLERIELTPAGESLFLLGYPERDQITTVTFGQGESVWPAAHDASVFSITLSVDGKWRATADANGVVCLSDSTNPHAPHSILRAHRGIVSTLAFSSDGRHLATGGADGMITIWDVERREKLNSLKGHLGRIHSVSFAPDGQSLASASEDGTSRVWNLRASGSSRLFVVHELPVFSLAYARSGSRLAVGTGSSSASPGGMVKVWKIPSGELVSHFPAADRRVMAIAFSPDGSRLIAGGYDSKLSVRHADTGLEDYSLSGLDSDTSLDTLQSTVGAVAVSPDGKYVVAGFGHPTFHLSQYKQVAKVWEFAPDWKQARLVTTLHGHTNTICEVAFSRDGKLLATAGNDHQVKLWSVGNWQLLRTLTGNEPLKSVAFSADGKWIVAGGTSGDVVIWETASGRPVHTLRGHADAVFRLAFSSDGRTLATASWDNTIKLWDPVSGRETRTLLGHKDWISSLTFAPDNNTLATGSFDGTVRLWEAASLQQIDELVEEDRKLANREETLRHRQQAP